MTSNERKELRYQRRKAKREKQVQRYSKYDDFEKVFTYENLYKSYKKCRRGVAWKSSTQKYISQAPLLVYQTFKKLHQGKFRSAGFYEFDIRERGKERHIRAVTIQERIVQRCLCDYALVPMLKKSLIYDNSATLENKGYHFAVKRLCKHLSNHYHKYGNKGYVLIFDFKKFFDSVSHSLCRKIIHKHFKDEKLLKLIEHFIDMFGEKGLGLGSQISQIFALSSANEIDHYIKEVCMFKAYGRYMDDGYIISPNKSALKSFKKEISGLCQTLHITLNSKKTQIVKLSHGFSFLKIKISLTAKGEVTKRMSRESIVRERRKLKKFFVFVKSGKMSVDDAYTSWQSWKSYADNFNSYRSLQTTSKLYNRLFITQGDDNNEFIACTQQRLDNRTC